MPKPRGSKREAMGMVDRQRVTMEHYLRGMTERSIARVMGVSHTTVQRDIAAIHTEWKATLAGELDWMKRRELERLLLVIEQAQASFDRSLRDAQCKTVTDSPEGTTTQERVEGQYGDPRFLALIKDTSESIRKLMGLDAPAKSEQRNMVDFPIVPRENLQEYVQQKLAEHAAKRQALPPSNGAH